MSSYNEITVKYWHLAERTSAAISLFRSGSVFISLYKEVRNDIDMSLRFAILRQTCLHKSPVNWETMKNIWRDAFTYINLWRGLIAQELLHSSTWAVRYQERHQLPVDTKYQLFFGRVQHLLSFAAIDFGILSFPAEQAKGSRMRILAHVSPCTCTQEFQIQETNSVSRIKGKRLWKTDSETAWFNNLVCLNLSPQPYVRNTNSCIVEMESSYLFRELVLRSPIRFVLSPVL